MKEQLKNCIEAYEQAQKKLAAVVQEEIAKAAEEFFQNDWLASFGWKQYTDYFNDGEECTFSVYSDECSLYINGDRADDNTWFSDTKYNNRNWEPNPNHDREKYNVVRNISKFIEEIGEDNLLNVFGDHKQITISKDGITVEDYSDHD